MSEKEHIHGGAPHASFEQLGVSPRRVIDFSVNISPLGPPRAIFRNWDRLSGEISVYPSVDGGAVTEYYTHRFGIEPESVLPGNGSTECIYLVPRVLGIQRACILTPSFHDYQRSCRVAGCEIVEYPLEPEMLFAPPSLKHLEKALADCDALFLGHPNNPTGTLFETSDLLALADCFPDKTFLIDEAFIQFLPDHSQRTLIAPERIRPNILVFHSLTKLYALPGIRLGAVVGHPGTIGLLKRFKEPWTINSVAERVVRFLIDCGDYEDRLRSLVEKEQQRFIDQLKRSAGLSLYPTPCNFMLARWEQSDELDDLLRFLLEHGIHVRDCRNFKGLEDRFFRFAILKTAENNRLIDLLTRCLQEYQS